eukprot:gene1219-1795_t
MGCFCKLFKSTKQKPDQKDAPETDTSLAQPQYETLYTSNPLGLTGDMESLSSAGLDQAGSDQRLWSQELGRSLPWARSHAHEAPGVYAASTVICLANGAADAELAEAVPPLLRAALPLVGSAPKAEAAQQLLLAARWAFHGASVKGQDGAVATADLVYQLAQEEVLPLAKELRKALKRGSPALLRNGASPAELALHVEALRATAIMQPNPEKNKEMLGMGLNLAVGIAKSVLEMKLDSQLVEGLQQAGGMLTASAQRSVVEHLAAVVAGCEVTRISLGRQGLTLSAMQLEGGAAVKLYELQQVSLTSLRWEAGAAFAQSIGDALLVSLLPAGSAVAEELDGVDPAMVRWLLAGDAGSRGAQGRLFLGLRGLAEFGAEPGNAPENFLEGAMVAVSQWAESFLSSTLTLPAWVAKGRASVVDAMMPWIARAKELITCTRPEALLGAALDRAVMVGKDCLPVEAAGRMTENVDAALLRLDEAPAKLRQAHKLVAGVASLLGKVHAVLSALGGSAEDVMLKAALAAGVDQVGRAIKWLETSKWQPEAASRLAENLCHASCVLKTVAHATEENIVIEMGSVAAAFRSGVAKLVEQAEERAAQQLSAGELSAVLKGDIAAALAKVRDLMTTRLDGLSSGTAGGPSEAVTSMLVYVEAAHTAFSHVAVLLEAGAEALEGITEEEKEAARGYVDRMQKAARPGSQDKWEQHRLALSDWAEQLKEQLATKLGEISLFDEVAGLLSSCPLLSAGGEAAGGEEGDAEGGQGGAEGGQGDAEGGQGDAEPKGLVEAAVDEVASAAAEWAREQVTEAATGAVDMLVMGAREQLRSASDALKLHVASVLSEEGIEALSAEIPVDGLLAEGAEALSSCFELLKARWGGRADASLIREVALASVLRLRRWLAQSENELCTDLRQEIDAVLVERKVYEAAPNVRELLNAKEQSLSDAELASAWAAQEAAISKDLKRRVAEVSKTATEAHAEHDVLTKQQMLARCRRERRDLTASIKEVGDIGAKLDLVLDYLTDMSEHLEVLEGKLDSIQEGIAVIQENMEAFLGRPPLQVVAEVLEREQAAELKRMKSEVYLDINAVYAGEDGKFRITAANPEFSLMEDSAKGVQRFFNGEKSVLLLSGPAGGGKSIALRRLRRYITTKYAQQRKEAGVDVLLLHVALASIQNPLTALFDEGLWQQYRLTPNQIATVRQDIRQGKVELVIVADGYDELQAGNLYKSLYMSNNLEQYRSDLPAPGTNLAAFPKVIISVRSELLGGWPGYQRTFTPVAPDSVEVLDGKDGDRGAFEEVRLAPFGQKTRQYMCAHASMEILQLYEGEFGHLPPLQLDFTKAGASKNELLLRVLGRGGAGGVPAGLLPQLLSAVERVESSFFGAAHEQHPAEGVLGLAGSLQQKLLRRISASSTQYTWGEVEATAVVGLYEAMRVWTELSARLGRSTAHTSAQVAASCRLIDGDVSRGDVKRAQEAAKRSSDVFATMVDWLQGRGEASKRLQAFTNKMIFQEEMWTEWLEGGSEATMKAELIILMGSEEMANLTWSFLRRPGSFGKEAIVPDNIHELRRGLEVSIVSSKALREHRAKCLRSLRVAAAETMRVAEERHRRSPGGGGGEALPITEDSVMGNLIRVLSRKPVRRFQIYEVFVERYLEHGASKLAARGNIGQHVLTHEAAIYIKRLAMQMTMEDQSKVEVSGDASRIFPEPDVWSVFFAEDELVRAVRDAAPLEKRGNVFCFIHKTVQEQLVAAAFVTFVYKSMRASQLSPGQLYERTRAVVAEVQASEKHGREGRLHSALSSPHMRAPRQLVEVLQDSPLNAVPLEREQQVADFLLDCILQQVPFAEYLGALCTLCFARDLHGGLLHIAQQNMLYLLTASFSRRSGGTLLHEAAKEGAVHIINVVCKLFEAMGDRGALTAVLERRDDLGRTPLFCAAQTGHADAVGVLEQHGASLNARSTLVDLVMLKNSDAQTLPGGAFVDGTSVVGPLAAAAEVSMENTGAEVCFAAGFPNARVSKGRWRFEVDVQEVPWTKVHALGAMCPAEMSVGWSTDDLIRSKLQFNSFNALLGRAGGIALGSDGVVRCGTERRSHLKLGPGGTRVMRPWVKNDTVGVLLDVDAKLAYFALNDGEWQPVALSDAAFRKWSPQASSARAKPETGDAAAMRVFHFARMLQRAMIRWTSRRRQLFPASSGWACGGRLRFNLGEKPWKCTAAEPVPEVRKVQAAALGNDPLMAGARRGFFNVVHLVLDCMERQWAASGQGEADSTEAPLSAPCAPREVVIQSVSRPAKRTLLHHAAFYGDEKLLLRALQLGADRFMLDADGRNALALAALNGHADLVALLAEKGCRVQGVDSEGLTPLHLAMRGEHSGAARLVAAAGDLEQRGEGGLTALLWCALKGFTGDAVSLVTSGAAVEARTRFGHTPLLLAVMGNHPETVKGLLEAGADVEACDHELKTPLLHAVELGHIEVLRVCLAEGAVVDKAATTFGQTPLMTAAEQGRMEMVRELLGCGADLLVLGRGGNSALMAAAGSTHGDVVEELLKAAAVAGGVDKVKQLVSVANHMGRTALMMAARSCSAEAKGVVQSLLRQGASADRVDNDGHSALSLAAANNSVEVAELLLEAGECIPVTSPGACKPHTPSFIARRHGSDGLAMKLEDAGA